MLGLSSLFISGLPGNRLEVFEGRAIGALPFRSREDAEATFELWVNTLGRWKECNPRTSNDGETVRASVAGYDLALSGMRIEARIPVSQAAVHELTLGFWNPALWPDSGGRATAFGEHQHALTALYAAFEDLPDADSMVFDRSDLVLDAKTILEPAFYLFRPDRWRWLGEIPGQYVEGVPEVVIEVLTPCTRPDDLPGTGRRARLLAAAGVQWYWLVDPGTLTLSVHELRGTHYRTAHSYHPGDRFCPEFPSGIEVNVDSLFGGDTGMSPVLMIPPGGTADKASLRDDGGTPGLEHLLLVGHPLHRYEVWEDAAPCVVALRDEQRAAACFQRWAREAAGLEGVTAPARAEATFECPHLRMWRDGPRVHLDLRYPATLQRELLETIALSEVRAAVRA